MPIRLGIVGASDEAREITDVLLSIEAATIVAVCDRDASRAESFARRCRARAFRDTKSMLKPPTKREIARRLSQEKNVARSEKIAAKKPPQPDVIQEDVALRTLDAVCVLTLERVRSEAIPLALQNGCEVFVASPVAFSLDGARKMVQSAQENRTRIWTSHDVRFSPSAQHARKLVSARGSQVSSVNGSWKIDIINSQSISRDLSVLTSSTRLIDALRFFGGEIKSVFARASNGNITLSIGFGSGVVGAIVLGENCETALHWTTQSSLLSWRYDEVVMRHNNATQRNDYSNGLFDARKAELRAWLQSVESGRRTLAKSKPEDAIQNLRVALAIVQSIKTNKPVRIGV